MTACQIFVLDQPIICGTMSELKVAPCGGELKRRGITLTDDGVGQLTVDTVWYRCCRAALHGKYTVTGLWAHCITNLLGMGSDGKDGGEVKVTDIYNSIDSCSNANELLELWKLDIPGILDPYECQRKEEMEAAVLEHLERTLRKDPEGRYELST